MCTDENVSGKFKVITTGAKKNALSKRAFEMVLAEIRDGRTLSMICADEAFPERGDVLRHLSNSEDAEAKMLRARRIGVWMQMDRIYEQLSNVEASKLPMLKEQASHIRWLAGKFGVGISNSNTKSGNEVIEVRWLDDLNEAPSTSQQTD